MNKSDSIELLISALVEAQRAFPAITRTKEVIVKTNSGAYAFKYAPLDEVIRLTRPALLDNGLAVSQAVCGDFLETRLLHKSGQWLTDSLPLRPGGTAKEYGAELTYKRRYGFTAMIGIAAEDDLDAKGADDEKPVKKSTKAVAESYESLPEDKQVAIKAEAKKIEADFYTKTINFAFERYEIWKEGKEVEEQNALWFCLDSKVRTAIKKYGESLKKEQ